MRLRVRLVSRPSQGHQPPQPKPAEETKAQPLSSELRVHNQALVDSSADKAACFLQFKQLEERLRERQDLSEIEKHRVAEQLGRRESISNLESHITSPDKAIAVALVASGAHDFYAAAQGMSDRDKDKLLRFLNDERFRNERLAGAAAGRAAPFGSGEPLPSRDGASKRAEEAKAQSLNLEFQDPAKAVREVEEARAAEQAAKETAAEAVLRHNEAIGAANVAQSRAAKAHRWEKKDSLAAEKEARQSLHATFEKHQEAEAAWGVERGRLKAAEERVREAQVWSAEAARLEKFQGTPEAAAKATKAILEAREAAQKLTAARTAEEAAQKGFDDERCKRDRAREEESYAQSRTWQAEERVRKAHLWEKKEARAAEKEARRGLDDVRKSLAEVKVALDEALKREYAARDRLKAAETETAAAQARSAEAVRINDLQATQKALQARADITSAEQHRIAEYLGRAANATILRNCDDPQQAIAAGMIASGTRNDKEATKKMEKPDAAKVVEAVEHNREIEKERSRDRGRGRDRGLERSL